MSGIPKAQHVIPRLHLQHFADASGLVWTYDKHSGRVWAAAAEETAVESHFYSGELPDGTMDVRIEEVIGRIESAAAPVYSALLDGKIPAMAAPERAAFAHFLGLMYARTRPMRRMAGEIAARLIQIRLYATARHSEAFEESMRRYEEELGRPIGPEEREEYRESLVDPSQFEFTVAKEVTFSVLRIADELAPLLAAMRWWIMASAEGAFITSDNPLVREVARSSVSAVYGDMGFVNPTAEVTFPLSPTKLLFMSRFPKERVASLPRELVLRANMARAAHSDQFLYASLNDPEIAQLAAQFRDSRPTVKTEGFGPKGFARVRVARRRRGKS